MLEVRNLVALARKEILDARRNRWFLFFAVAFTVLSLALAWFGMAGPRTFGVEGFGRTAASLINLVLLVVSLMGLTLGALSLAGEREHGTLLYILAQPVNLLEVLVGKFAGLATALTAALALGFGLTGLAIAWWGGGARVQQFLWLVLLSGLLALVALSVGFLLSSGLRKGATAIGLALFVWLALVFFSDLGLMGASITLRPRVETLLLLAVLNPLQVFRMAAILTLQGSLEVLGPAGVYALRAYGSAVLPMLVGILVLWVIVPFALTYLVLRKRGAV